MTKHMPDVPAGNRSKEGPGDHHEVGSDTTHENRPDDLNASRQGDTAAMFDRLQASISLDASGPCESGTVAATR